jgi:rhodanese-related sulfurtransferase
VWPAVNAAPRLGMVSVTEAVNLINREKGQVIDVSEPDEFSKGHVGGAKNLPLGQVEERLASMVKNKALPVIFVCTTGSRSGKAVAMAKKAGFAQAKALQGGTQAWRAASMPIDSSAQPA